MAASTNGLSHLSQSHVRDLDLLARRIQSSDPKDAQAFLEGFANSQSPAWLRYSEAIYNHPKTWWIGVIRLSMLTGVWGEKHRVRAAIRQNFLH